MKRSVMILFSLLIACQGLTIPNLSDEEKAEEGSNVVASEPTTEASENAEETEATPKPSSEIGSLAPNFTLPTLTGEDVSLQDFRGQVVLLNFWATWCGPCRQETPDLQRLSEKYQEQDLVVLGVSVDTEETVDAVPDFIEEFALTYPILLDTDLEVFAEYADSGGIPQSYFIDAEGIIREISLGALEWDFMEGNALSLLDPEAGETRLAALELVTEGRELAQAGDIDGAAAKFQEALTVDPGLTFDDPQAEAKRVAALALVQQGAGLAQEGQVEEALAAFEEAQTLDPSLEIPASLWNNLCWFGSLWGYAAEVFEACEKGVELADAEAVAAHRDSRGVARALTGDYAGAIEDFEVFVAWTKENGQYEEYGSKREAWIAELQAERNPFDEETLEALRDE
jgi:peroxiredoxin